MAWRKILLDTCVYLRLARHVHPLLAQDFGNPPCRLYLIPEFQDEFLRQPRLQGKFAWVADPEYVQDRSAPMLLTSDQLRMRDRVAEALDADAFDRDIALSRVDISAMASALVMELPLASDDGGLRELAEIWDVECVGTLALLRHLRDQVRVDGEIVERVLREMEQLPDMPAGYTTDKRRLFPEFPSRFPSPPGTPSSARGL